MQFDDALFEEKYQLYHDTVYRIACSYASSRSDVEDIVQDVFLQYFRKSPSFNGEDHERFWIVRVTINIAKNYNKVSWKRNVTLDEDIVYLEGSKQVNTKDEDHRILDAIASLPDKYKQVIILFYYEDYSSEMIAKTLGISVSNVNTRLSRGREKLRSKLEVNIDE